MLTDPEICPSCGSLDVLDEITGWCPACAGTIAQICVRCKSSFSSSKFEYICNVCKTENWANEIERVMVLGNVSYTRAKSLVATGNQATCLCCGGSMPRATKGRHLFCSRPRCKSASRRVKHLRLSKSLSHSQALNQVLREVGAEKAA